MCKFQKPQIPANVTGRRKGEPSILISIPSNLSDKVEKYNDLTYLSWANAWVSSKDAIPQPPTGLSRIRRPTFHILQILVSVSWSIQK